MFRGLKVLVTGGTGLIGSPLVELLVERGAKVKIVSLDHPSRAHVDAEFVSCDITDFRNCLNVCEGMDIVFHLAGVKGSPAMTAQQPASFFVPMLQFNTNMHEAARRCQVGWYMFTSSVGVYQPAPLLKEDDVWTTMPSRNDWFAGWAKRMGELQGEAYRIQYGWDRTSVVRPANVYGRLDNFDPANAMVIPALIRRALDGENPLTVWGDGTPVRDFIHACDVARGMLFAVENRLTKPINLGSGQGVTIKRLVEIILANMEHPPEVVWDTQKPAGDKQRLMDMSLANSFGFQTSISIEDGVKDVMSWYRQNRQLAANRYNVFNKAA